MEAMTIEKYIRVLGFVDEYLPDKFEEIKVTYSGEMISTISFFYKKESRYRIEGVGLSCNAFDEIPQPSGWGYTSLFDLSMGFLRGDIEPLRRFKIKYFF